MNLVFRSYTPEEATARFHALLTPMLPVATELDQAGSCELVLLEGTNPVLELSWHSLDLAGDEKEDFGSFAEELCAYSCYCSWEAFGPAPSTVGALHCALAAMEVEVWIDDCIAPLPDVRRFSSYLR